jgi:hypothetical protein
VDSIRQLVCHIAEMGHKVGILQLRRCIEKRLLHHVRAYPPRVVYNRHRHKYHVNRGYVSSTTSRYWAYDWLHLNFASSCQYFSKLLTAYRATRLFLNIYLYCTFDHRIIHFEQNLCSQGTICA